MTELDEQMREVADVTSALSNPVAAGGAADEQDLDRELEELLALEARDGACKPEMVVLLDEAARVPDPEGLEPAPERPRARRDALVLMEAL